jgi:hypothetical protein
MQGQRIGSVIESLQLIGRRCAHCPRGQQALEGATGPIPVAPDALGLAVQLRDRLERVQNPSLCDPQSAAIGTLLRSQYFQPFFQGQVPCGHAGLPVTCSFDRTVCPGAILSERGGGVVAQTSACYAEQPRVRMAAEVCRV